MKSKNLCSKLIFSWGPSAALVVVFTIVLFWLGTFSSSAQSPVLPSPTPLALASDADAGPTATIGFANSASVRTHSIKGHFGLTDIRPHEAVNIGLRYRQSFAGTAVFASVLDGGEATVSRPNAVIAPDGTTGLRFKAGDRPGLYRVLLIAGGSRSILQFWIADPNNPQNNPPRLNPGN